MAETVTQDATSGEAVDGGQPTPTAPSGEPGTVTSTADAFAAERARLEAQAREWQGKFDRLQAETTRTPPATPAPAPQEGVLTMDTFRAELRRQREIDSAVGALKEQFPNAMRTFAQTDSFESVEAMRVAAENEQSAFTAQVGPAVEAAVAAALKPYVEKFGPLQQPPAGAQPGQGDGLPTYEEVAAMNLDERDALEKAHPGHAERVIGQRLSSL